MDPRLGFENQRYLQPSYGNPLAAPAAPSLYYSTPPQIFLPVEKKRLSLPFWLQSFSALLGAGENVVCMHA
jgi:hypothetical protein